MFDDRFTHYLSYGAADQETLRELQDYYDGLIVPGTVAAFQHEGTGGFVLTLSATVEGAPYSIDPRFPLFQQALPEPKRSHEALAQLLGVPSLIRANEPAPEDFTADVIDTVAGRWAEFNQTYRGVAGGKFEKYARRLNEPVRSENATAPLYVLAPYFVASGPHDQWWEKSDALYQATVEHISAVECLRVVACAGVSALGGILPTLDDKTAIIWVSGLSELESPLSDLAEYLAAIGTATKQGLRLFALYGGFFSVLAGNAGLAGACHGIGYGEHRSWPELPRSGPPPARFYLPILHRYVSQEDAQRLWMIDRSVFACPCVQCSGRAPIELEYHDLMKHSVLCRSLEIDEWAGLDPENSAGRLEEQLEVLLGTLVNAGISDLLWNRMQRNSEHISTWIGALRYASG